ncbi:hypothetical protein GXP70_06935 [Paenibacillus lycopersici]|uniref:Uncharacterized protein n=1 Tax=Paenibacillus lycopersici TaxID=2704462 RepID=A0A6C0FUM7_9BACL|nr:hypothetical protein [Paenibacillus lycopersici]QHT59712.1 hypothetical protein GXP70_06935 [Paenibacillus lycopersici]
MDVVYAETAGGRSALAPAIGERVTDARKGERDKSALTLDERDQRVMALGERALNA